MELPDSSVFLHLGTDEKNEQGDGKYLDAACSLMISRRVPDSGASRC